MFDVFTEIAMLEVLTEIATFEVFNGNCDV